jgi:hypothetical protein
MSIEMDSGVSVPGARFGAVDVEADTAETQSGWDEGVMMVVATIAGVLAASSLAVWVYLS